MKNFLLIFILFLSSFNCFAQDKIIKDEFVIKIKNHRFEPDLINVPADTKFKIIIENLDNTIEEFESDDLKKEKLVGAGKKVSLQISPLKAGEYKFYGDFHQKTAQGKIISK
jgi:plastocyanin